ncbi:MULTISPECIES: bacillithiol system redox-active protein YtxJ [unclassified Polaribacter]|uniref:bacillithiol system redox-active protein YtxJ n=1 Tax=unclassified Polaribacter TaxID=196858 RepID=UPI0011BDB55E|nr:MULTISPECIES: bacillithiol system redox-active protein YtxJ [unclassified Polaribacter]TXD51751.1 bacillithiol system redox-active protein YtxJ [Polaribacter sp. IC063]TXD58962.1 bacillithiol system redox-active protein YtxJ [Polaribacter sp. IC066]
MGILNNIFGSKDGEKSKEEKKSYLNWIPLTSLDQLNEIKEQSKIEAVLIFKDSTRCGISKVVIKQFQSLFLEEHQNLKVYYLDLLNHRDISAEIGVLFDVTHQSPQLIVVKNEVSVHHASHSEITEVNLSRFI